MKNIFLALFFVATYSSGQVTFQKYYTDSFGAVRMAEAHQLPDSGYIIGGSTGGLSHTNHLLLMRMNKYGDTLWTSQFGGTSDDLLFSVQQTFDGGFIVCGETKSFGNTNGDIYLLKTDAGGNVLWSKTYGEFNEDKGGQIMQTPDSGYIFLCTINHLNSIIRTNSAGDTLWTRKYTGRSLQMHHINSTTDGGYIVAGLSNGNSCLIKLDATGNTTWSKTYTPDSTIAQGSDNYSVQQTADGGYITFGILIRFHTLHTRGYIIKTDSTGNLTWAKYYQMYSYTWFYNGQQTNDGGYIVSGGVGIASPPFLYDYFVESVKLDPNGNYLWDLHYTLDGSSSTIEQTFDNGYIISSNGALSKTDMQGHTWCNESVSGPTGFLISTQVGISAFNDTSVNITVATPSTISFSTVINVTTGCFDLGIDKMEDKNSLVIFPNPATVSFTVSTDIELKGAQIEIFDLPGKKIYSSPYNKRKVIDCKLFQKGIYFICVRDDEKRFIRKLVVD